MNISFTNWSMQTGEKYADTWYDWCVFVKDDPKIMSSINSVEYILHSSFPDPIRVVTERPSRFALFSSGWGSFPIRIQVYLEDGSTYFTSYELELKPNNWPTKKAADAFADKRAATVYKELTRERYRWRKLATIVRNTGLPIEEVLQILNELQQENVARKAPFLSIDNNELWGATSVVGISPRI